ncbi:hypothetical protein DLAC_11205 [Tieghemostelium lacteum]|uniref:Vacuolar protein 14 C-terminal Fig4-binding domain-containing protein n=1 Tax=Tieghemostelium lacteum TaxID=361077 RepID=A0A151Z3G4_TIELA|nr:hypothetical protein DLAC_11205 [Tieghemostelium lacteum]|eukprot:KYQ88491.1 hypothetical protein DLAC_11205 [Tieghemostelium lacteum]
MNKSTSSSIDQPIPIILFKNLTDKNTDKRKAAAQEVEQLIRDLYANDEQQQIRQIIKVLSNDYTDSSQGNNKKGGLMGLASVAIGLGSNAHQYIQTIIPPVLRCFLDHDSRVRFYACESLFNIAKVTRSKILYFFNEIFDALCKLSADLDPQVKGGAQLFDRLLKDIVTENPNFDLEKFIPLLRERVYVINTYCRQFLVGWIVVLDSVPNIDILVHLPKFLDGLFKMLKDQNKEIRNEVDKALSEFLRELQTAENVDYGSMVKIVIAHCTSNDEFTRLRAITWINEFIIVGREKLIAFSPAILNGLLSSLNHQSSEIEQMASLSTINLHKLVMTTQQDIPIAELLQFSTQHLSSQSVQSKLSSLNWILMLHNKANSSGISSFLADIYPPLLKTLSDNSDEVVKFDLEVIAKISDNTELLDKLIQNLVVLFQSDSQLLRTRGNFIIRQLCQFLSPELIFRRFANLINSDENPPNPEFTSVLVQSLNLILLTSDECVDIRRDLRDLTTSSSRDLFQILYKSWAHSPASLFSLCMLTQVYEHSCALLSKFSEIEINVNFLMEMDRLVQLLESPKFMALRLQLLEPEKYPSLFKALYGLLMILPQSSAFETLKNRLTCISSLGVLNLIEKKENEDGNNPNNNPGLKEINFQELLNHFKKIQQSIETFQRQKPKQSYSNMNTNQGGSSGSGGGSFEESKQLPYGIQSYINNKKNALSSSLPTAFPDNTNNNTNTNYNNNNNNSSIQNITAPPPVQVNNTTSINYNPLATSQTNFSK